MNKRLNTDSITNDLEGSAFFPKRESRLTAAPESLSQQADSNQPVRPNDRPNGPDATKRIITRNSFETFEDQMDSLREIAYFQKRLGKVGSMSAMVREAIDDFLVKNKALFSK
ncbi:hypothetical protein [Streptomyces sp. NPDC093514]|uniref:hypothetical protein n=1 Tax=Streptomyces sp. NPDC093514 TaxID=3366039 RepID=UPI00382D7518